MADFDGEDLLSDDELSQINAHAHFGHLSSMASMYHTHMPHGKTAYWESVNLYQFGKEYLGWSHE
jgi:hypothetical protein